MLMLLSTNHNVVAGLKGECTVEIHMDGRVFDSLSRSTWMAES